MLLLGRKIIKIIKSTLIHVNLASVRLIKSHKKSLPESAWGAVSSVHVGKARADHRMAGHLTSLAAQSLQGRVVTVGELKKEKKVFRAVLAGAQAGS